VNTNTVSTATRAFAQARVRRVSTTSTVPAAYPEPRNAAVAGGSMVQANSCSVCGASTSSATNPSTVSALNATSSTRIPGDTGRGVDRSGAGVAVSTGVLR
jgi:hypothetical protein